MSRYVFAAAAALFAGLLLILALSLAQRDARISDTLQVDAVPNYAEQVVAPISVNKAALEDEASLVAPRIESVLGRVIHNDNLQFGMRRLENGCQRSADAGFLIASGDQDADSFGSRRFQDGCVAARRLKPSEVAMGHPGRQGGQGKCNQGQNEHEENNYDCELRVTAECLGSKGWP